MKALVLSGGGSKGSYQVGVWKALRKLNIKYDIITGTSVGALNGAIMVQNDYLKALKIWKKLNLQVLFGEDAATSTNNFDVYKMYGEEFLKNGGIDATRLENLIKETIDLRKFYNSNIDFGLITYNLTTNKPLSITKKEIKPDKIIVALYLNKSPLKTNICKHPIIIMTDNKKKTMNFLKKLFIYITSLKIIDIDKNKPIYSINIQNK